MTKFTKEEDELILQYVERDGAKNWSKLQAIFKEKSQESKSIRPRNQNILRERYINYLDPNVNHSQWTAEEDQRLIKLYCDYGSKWSFIAQYFPGRTHVQLKNRWCHINKQVNDLITVVEHPEKEEILNSDTFDYFELDC